MHENNISNNKKKQSLMSLLTQQSKKLNLMRMEVNVQLHPKKEKPMKK